MVGRLGEVAMGATTLTVRLNMISFLPMMGLGQAVCILVGQRLGANRPDLAEKSAKTGLKWTFGYMCAVAAIYLTLPGLIVSIFEGGRDAQDFAAVAAIVPGLLVCVAAYSVVDSVNVTFWLRPARRGGHAVRDPGDVLPGLAHHGHPDLPGRVGRGQRVLAWCFATAHIFAMAACFALRFRAGKWKTMRVIEPEMEAVP